MASPRAMIIAARAAMRAFVHDPQCGTIAPPTPLGRTKMKKPVWLTIDNVRYKTLKCAGRF